MFDYLHIYLEYMRVIVAGSRHLVALVLHLIEVVDLRLELHFFVREFPQLCFDLFLRLEQVVMARCGDLLPLGCFNYQVKVGLLLAWVSQTLRLLRPFVLHRVLSRIGHSFLLLDSIFKVRTSGCDLLRILFALLLRGVLPFLDLSGRIGVLLLEVVAVDTHSLQTEDRAVHVANWHQV